MKSIGLVSVGRSDYGIYRPLIQAIDSDPDLKLQLIVGGMHLSSEHGLTKKLIEEDGYPILASVDMLLASNSPEGTSKSIGLGVIGFSQVFAEQPPDMLVVLGDRFEMFAAPIAALPFRIPVAHIHGGELTFGAFDDAIRHSITKLSHLHFASTQVYANRIIQMGEEPWRVHNVGSLSIDNLQLIDLFEKEKFLEQYSMSDEYILVTFHPVTLEIEQAQFQIDNLIGALREWGGDVLFTMPNSDPGSRIIRDQIDLNVGIHENWISVENLGTQRYFSAMKYASVMLGNSSSGIIESSLFDLPVVNVGTRQSGRIRGPNIIDVGYNKNQILQGIYQALSVNKTQIETTPIYGEGNSAKEILKVIKNTEINKKLLIKKFYDL